MDFVVDANIVISGLITSNTKTNELIFKENISLLAPEYLKSEIEKHHGEIIKKAGLNEADFALALNILLSRIKLVPFSEFESFIAQASAICPDPKDVEYFALALKYNCALWSQDKELRNQNTVKVLNITEMIHYFETLP